MIVRFGVESVSRFSGIRTKTMRRYIWRDTVQGFVTGYIG
jgi:hypothetical protein